jgi:hypothetical protein
MNDIILNEAHLMSEKGGGYEKAQRTGAEINTI